MTEGEFFKEQLDGLEPKTTKPIMTAPLIIISISAKMRDLGII
jgi:hypothetical protein